LLTGRREPVAEIDRDDELAAREAERAAAEAAAIGGRASSEPGPADGAASEAERPLAEAGQGEAEGFELAEQELVEHASHGDQHAARRAIEDAPSDSDDAAAASAGEADREYSSERDDDR
jgi:hypothetical protein